MPLETPQQGPSQKDIDEAVELVVERVNVYEEAKDHRKIGPELHWGMELRGSVRNALYSLLDDSKAVEQITPQTDLYKKLLAAVKKGIQERTGVDVSGYEPRSPFGN